MAKRINQLTKTTTLIDDDVIAVDSSDSTGQTRSIAISDVKKNMLSHSAFAITTATKFQKIYYDNTQYIEKENYTKSYIATANCTVFWHIEWDCEGSDGLTLEIIDKSFNVKAEITIMRDFEGNGSEWMNRNGSISLGPGIGIRFRGKNYFNTNAGHCMTYLVATN